MSNMGSATVYFPDNKIPRTSSYSAFLNEKNFSLLKTGNKENTGLLQGPRRVLRLCLFSLVLPTVLIVIPLYVRLVMYPPGNYPMMPTDQRVLSRHVSSVWCQAQTTQMNGTFSTFKSLDTPSLRPDRQRYVMLHSTILRDDIKEYWGFHLLKGSKVTVSTCSSREGAQLMILRGIENLRRCAWIGEEDSDEEFEETGGRGGERDRSENEGPIVSVVSETPRYNVESQIGNRNRDTENNLSILDELKADQNETLEILYEDESEERRQNLQQLLLKAMRMSKGKKEILRLLHLVGKGRNKPLSKNVRKMMGMTSDERNESFEPTTSSVIKKKIDEKNETTASSSELTKLRFTRSINQEIEEYDGAFEEFDDDDDEKNEHESNDRNPNVIEKRVIKHIFYPEGLKFERGKFNQTNQYDSSNEEHESSYSSSEEALARCEGVILTLPLVAYRSCSYRWMEMNKITYDIPITGTYYFVYSSDNEIDRNTIYLNMTFEKVVYDVDQSETVCSNATDCSVPIKFWSNQKTIVELPQESTWDHSYELHTACEPRVAIYLTFLLLVPLLILFCAYQ